jgi:hypothetical protein
MQAGTGTAFWSESALNISAPRMKAIGLLERLTTLLQGPHEYLHDFVAPNWDHGALYAFLQSSALEHLALSGGSASLPSLSEDSGIPEDKLARILALLRCRNIVNEPELGVFTLNAVSEELVKDQDFRAWVEFQYVVHTSSKLTLVADSTGCLRREWLVLILRSHLLTSRTIIPTALQVSNKRK